MQILERLHIIKYIKLVQLADIIINHMNIRRNDVVIVHQSLHNIKHSDFQPEDVIYLLKMIIGKEGTLLMPVFGKSNLAQFSSQSQNEKCNSLPGNDIITGLFQQMQDTIIGNYPNYTLAAWGKHAIFITETNTNIESGLDIVNLCHKLNEVKAKFIGIKVPSRKFSFFNYSTQARSKILSSKYSDKVHDKSLELIMELFKENELKMFSKQGISYIWVDSEKE